MNVLPDSSTVIAFGISASDWSEMPNGSSSCRSSISFFRLFVPTTMPLENCSSMVELQADIKFASPVLLAHARLTEQ